MSPRIAHYTRLRHNVYVPETGDLPLEAAVLVLSG